MLLGTSTNFTSETVETYFDGKKKVTVTSRYSNNKEKQKIISVKCKNCGATNKFIIENENRCEYCNSVLNDK